MKKQILFIINFFFKTKKFYLKPSERKFLVFDKRNLFVLKHYIDEKKINVISTRGEDINIYVLIYTIIKYGFKNFRINYINSFINITNTKCCITLNHAYFLFYRIKELNNNVITIAFQNGHILIKDHEYKFLKILNSENKKNKKKPRCDYILTQNNFFSKSFFNKYFLAKSIEIGSYRNNFYKKNFLKRKKIISFISQYRLHFDTKNSLEKGGIYETEKKLLPMIYNFCKKNEYQFYILGSEWDENREKNFYQNIMGNEDWIFKKRTVENKSYYWTDQSELVIFVDSNLGFESLARGNKTISFNLRKNWNKAYKNWGIDFIKSKGKFWSTNFNNIEFKKLMKSNLKVNQRKWIKNNKKIINKLISYDPENKIFKKIISTIKN